jgi:hypothetical protein
MDPQNSAPNEQAKTAKRPYQKPELIVHGTLGELTQAGGTQGHPDGLFTRKLS